MTYKFKVGDAVLAKAIGSNALIHRGVITELSSDLSRWHGYDDPYYTVFFAEPGDIIGVSVIGVWAEDRLQLIEDPNDIMKEIL